MSPSPSELSTFVNLLRWRAESQSEQRVYTYLLDGEKDAVHRTYGELDARARAIAAELQKRNLSGERAVLIYPPGFEYIAAFFGCLYAGVVAAPLAPPDPSRLDRTLPQVQAIAKAAQAGAVLTTTSLLTLKAAPGLSLDGLQWIGTDFIDTALGTQWEPLRLDPESLAFLQYTSGSTGTPKGVMLSHRNLMVNSEAIRRLSEGNPEDIQVSWIPHFHNMGLIGGILQPVYAGHLGILMSPLAFLQRPMRWLEAMSRFQATISPGPNFAFELCARRFQAEAPQASPSGETLDLSRWKLACSGAEPVRSATLDLFSETFAPYGFRREAFFPAYGLAEATLIVSGGKCSEPPIVGKFQETSLQQNKAVAADRLDESPKNLVGCGGTLPGQTLLIVDPDRRIPCRADEIGEIWVSGPSVAQGYWNLPEETAQTFRGFLADTGAGPFLRTGDLGFLREGELFVTGRLKEMILIRGENRYPQDIEATVEKAHPAVRPSCIAAFSIEAEGEEKLVIMAEVDEDGRDALDSGLAAIRAAVSQNHNLQAHDVVLLRGGSVLKTPTGKIQRQRCKAAYLKGEYEALAQWSRSSTQTNGDSPAGVRLDASDAWTLATIAQKLHLAPTEIKLDASLAGYGLDSLAALDLAQTLEERLHVAVPLSLLFESVSIGHILDQLKTLPKLPPGSRGRVDLLREAVLDQDISPESATRERGDPKNPRSIFLTGATGFVGAYLLKELAAKTDADLYCLVRVSSKLSEEHRIESARNKVRSNLEAFGLWDAKLAARVIGVPGDLASPRLGLSELEFRKLATIIDAIYHNGASVNFIYPYQDLKASNVSGTQEILRLACQEKLKPVHYISTIGVFPGAGHPRGRRFAENDPLDSCHGLLNAYSESKWVAEKVLQIGRSRGIPVVIYRLGEVVGSEKTGALNAHRDVNSNMIKGALEIGKVPRINLNWYLVPVDFAAGAVAYLSLQASSEGQTFHLVNPEPLSLAEVYRSLTSLGYPLDSMPYREWLEEVADFTRVFPKNALTSFMPFLKREAVTELGMAKTMLKVDCRRTWEALGDAPLSCPPPKVLLNRLISYLEASGFLFTPQPVRDSVETAYFPEQEPWSL